MILIRSLIYLFLICMSTTLFSCRGSQDAASKDLPTDTATAPDTNASAPPDNTAGFSFKLKSTSDYTYILHKGTGAITDNFSEPCTVATTDGSAAADIMCVAEAPEMDLFVNGVGFRYNVPQSLCEYVTLLTPYYYNYRAGDGPTTVIDNRLGTNSLTRDGITALIGELKVGADTKSSIYCDTNYADKLNPDYIFPDGGPNCCGGGYTLYTSDAVNAVTTKEDNIWGGEPGLCLAGPAVSGIHTLDKSGYPKIDIFSVLKTGLNQGYDVKSPVSMGYSSNIFAANYFNPAEHVITGSGVPVAFAGATGADPTSPYHTLTCYNRHKEVKARIRLLVREWNLLSEYNLGAAGDPDATGNEANFGAPPINDFRDIKDVGDDIDLSYPKETQAL